MNPEIQLFGRQVFALCTDTHDFLLSRFDRVEAATEFLDTAEEPLKMRLSTLRGYYDRMLTWLSTVKKLNDPKDIQAVTVAARTLLEIAIDLIISHNTRNEKPGPFEKIFMWERSAKLKQAEKVREFFKGKTMPDEYQVWITFLNSPEASDIRAFRDKWWKGSHPNRWTDWGLADDAKRADGYFPEARLNELYQLQFAQYCWDTHGSGLAGFRTTNPDLVPAKCSQTLWEVHRFALLIARFVLEDLGLYLEVEFDDFQTAENRKIEAIV